MSDLPIFDRTRRLDPDPDPDGAVGDLMGEVITLADHMPGGDDITIDPETGDISIPTEDGGVQIIIDAPEEEDEEDDQRFYANLAGKIDDYERGRIVEEVLRGIEADDESRREWLNTRAEGIKMLGTALEHAQSDAGNSTGPFEGMSSVRHPLLLEAIVRFQSNAAAELYPPSGPVKVRDDRPTKPKGVMDMPNIGHNGGPPLDDPMQSAEIAAADQVDREELSEALEKGFNHNLTVVDRGYRPDSVRMLFWVGFGGCAFKKIYDCPIKQRPVSRYVDASDIIVSNAVSDHRDAGRITHRIVMRPALVKRMQIAGVYRNIELHEPQFQANAQDEAVAKAQGLAATPQRQEDQPRTLYESYVELDIVGYEHKQGTKLTGIPLPWKVTIDKDARELLELRRNWDEDDDTYTARQVFVKFGFIPAMGFYDLGLLHLLGNGDRALTAAWRIALDAGMFNNFPGFIYNEGTIRNWTNQNRVPPGGGIGIKAPANVPLNQLIQPLPYKDISAGLVGMITHVEQRMDRVAGTAELPVGEGRQDAPVGTTLALIEQATKVLAAVHINLHDAQSEEFQILKDRYRENPEAFWRWNKKARAWEKEEFLRALEDFELVPAADPNTPAHMIRLIKCQAVKTVAQLNPQLYDMQKVDEWIFKMIGVSDPDQFFAPPPNPGDAPPDPMIIAAQMQLEAKKAQIQAQLEGKLQELQLRQQESAAEHQAKMMEIAAEQQARGKDHEQGAQEAALASADRAADRQSEERRQILKMVADLIKLEAQHQQQTSTQARQQAHDAGKQQSDQLHQHVIGHQDRQHQMATQGLDRQADFLQQGRDQQHQMTQADQDRQHQSEQQKATLEHQKEQAREAAKAARSQGLAKKPPRQF